MTHYILDDAGDPQPCDLMTWGKWFQADPTRRRIALDIVGTVEVSTVFLGLDHQFGAGEPLIFETMVFFGPLDGEQERYSTKAQALAGHAAILSRVIQQRPICDHCQEKT